MTTPPISPDQIARRLKIVARMVAIDPATAPIFERLEHELAAARAHADRHADIQRRARAFIQSATGPKSADLCSSDAPAP